jgi:DNA-binding phage protein
MDALMPILRSSKTSKLSESSGASKSTLYNWRKKKTKRPQFCTVSAVALAAGCYGIDFVDSVPVLRQEPNRKLKVVK